MNGALNGVPLGDHGDTVAKLDETSRPYLAIVINGDAITTERMTMWKHKRIIGTADRYSTLFLSHPHHDLALGMAGFQIRNRLTDLGK